MVKLIKWFKYLFAKKLTKEQLNRAKVNGIFFELDEKWQIDRERKCNHRKGGYCDWTTSKITNGTDSQFAIIKHQLPMGDWIIRCLRCGKEWRKGDKNYNRALNAPTMNVSSTSIQFTNNQAVIKPVCNGLDEADEFVRYEIDVEVA